MLLVLPCPWRCLCITYEYYHACKLLLCGDIECNPGPTVEYMFERIIETQKAIQQDISNLMTMQPTLRESLEMLSARMNNIDKVFTESQASLNPIAPIEQHMRLLQQSFGTQHHKLIGLEDHSRRCNIIVYGIPEVDPEAEKDLRDKVLVEVFEKRLGVPVSSVARIHRLGRRKNNGKNRPIILNFQDFNEKKAVFSNVPKLKGSAIHIQHDNSQKTLRKRKLLWDSAAEQRTNGHKAILFHDKLKVNKQTFVWDDSENKRVQLLPSSSTSN